LEEALMYLLDTDIRLINLSLSVINGEVVNDLHKLCNEFLKNADNSIYRHTLI